MFRLTYTKDELCFSETYIKPEDLIAKLKGIIENKDDISYLYYWALKAKHGSFYNKDNYEIDCFNENLVQGYVWGFNTKNSTYYVDQSYNLIWGGILGNTKHPYKKVTATQGSPAIINLSNGKSYKTGVVQNYI